MNRNIGNDADKIQKKIKNYTGDLKMTEKTKKNDKGKQEKDGEFVASDVWINKTRSKKGFSIKVNNDMYFGAISQLKRFVEGDIDGIRLSRLEEKEEKEDG